jgi:hypothetical protein
MQLKKIFIPVIVISFIPLLFSCSNESKVKDNLQDYVESDFDDPDSYELLDIYLIDTVLVGDAVQYIIDNQKSTINKLNEYIEEKDQELRQRGTLLFMRGKDLRLFADLEELEQEKIELGKYTDTILILEKNNNYLVEFLNNDEIVYFLYGHSYRTKNTFGAIQKYLDTVEVDKNLIIIKNPNIKIQETLELQKIKY